MRETGPKAPPERPGSPQKAGTKGWSDPHRKIFSARSPATAQCNSSLKLDGYVDVVPPVRTSRGRRTFQLHICQIAKKGHVYGRDTVQVFLFLFPLARNTSSNTKRTATFTIRNLHLTVRSFLITYTHSGIVTL